MDGDLTTTQLLVNGLIYIMLPVWVLTGMVDWFCHRASKIEQNAGLKESLLHIVMAVQMGVPLGLCLLFRVNILILLICFAAWGIHEILFYLDLKYAREQREISILETHVHVYLVSMPSFILFVLCVIHWQMILKLLHWDIGGEMSFELVQYYNVRGDNMRIVMLVLFLLAGLLYVEETIRCWRYAVNQKRLSQV